MPKPKGLGKPQAGERGAKIGAYGQFGCGKTELVMSATKIGHLLLVDAEGRSQYYDPEANHGFEAIYSKNVQDALDLLAYAEELRRKGESVVFAVDGFSSMWFEQQEVAEQIGKTRRGTAKFDSWGPAKKPLKRFYARLFETPVDCIVTMRAKPKYNTEKKGSSLIPEDAGYDVPDIERGLNYAVDLVVELGKDQLPPGTPLKPENFYAMVVKTSGPKDSNPLPIGTRISDPSFMKLMALRLSGNGDHLQIAGADVGLQAALATVKNAGGFKRWIAGLGLDEETVFAALRDKFGGWNNTRLPDYINEVWAIHKGE